MDEQKKTKKEASTEQTHKQTRSRCALAVPTAFVDAVDRLQRRSVEQR
jgi:hypothetical protein